MISSKVVKKERDSNMELLRIIAMVIIMLVHANFRALGYPDADELALSPFGTFMRYLSEAFCIMGVNVFVMLSGWYGIRLKPMRLFELFFQITFFVIVAIMASCIHKHQWPNMSDLGFFFMKNNYDYWFIKAYLMLYILSPVLNSFVDYSEKKLYQLVLVLFFSFTFLWGWLTDGAIWLKHGHSGIFFCGLYLLSRYIRLYYDKREKISKVTCVIVYVIIAFSLAIMAFVLLKMGETHFIKRIYYYTCPIVIIQAVVFLLFFTKISLCSRFVNWVACSTLAIYLLHSARFLSTYFYDYLIADWHTSDPTIIFVVKSLGWVFVVFWLSIILDKMRMGIWHFFISTITTQK